MNKEDLFIGFGNLDEDLLRRSEQGGRNMNKKRNISKIVKYGSIAACLVVVLGVGIGAFVKTSIINQEPEKTIVVDNTGVEENDVPSIDQERFIAIDTLLASADGSQSQQAMKGCKVQIDKYTAVYEAVASVSSEQLEKSMGKEVEANEETYYVSGHNDLQYIITKFYLSVSIFNYHTFLHKIDISVEQRVFHCIPRCCLFDSNIYSKPVTRIS